MVTELEMSSALAAGSRYVLRYHKTNKASATLFDTNAPDAAFWTGFRYRDTQWSFVKFAAKPGTVVGFC
jgi:hypothetical protein